MKVTAHECHDCHHQWADDDPDDPVDEDWGRIDLADIAAKIRSGEHQPITPTILAVTGAPPLFYPQRINSLFGESGGGKTWVALAAVAEVARAGERALLIDYEDNPAGIAERLVLLGLADDEIANVDYRNPTSGIGLGLNALREAEHDAHWSLIIIDSTGEAMAAGAIDSNADREVAQWFALVKLLMRLPGGPAVVVLDHVPKDKDAPSSYAIGSQRKRAAVTGAAYRVDTLKEPAKGRNGKLKLTVAKDRPGNRPKGAVAAEVDVLSSAHGVRIELHISEAQAAAEHGQPFRPTVLMERVSRYLETVPSASARNVEQNVTGKAQGIRTAIEVLVAEGYIKAGQHGYESLESYREATDNGQRVPASPARPTASRDAAEWGASPASRAYISTGRGTRPQGVETHQTDGGRVPAEIDDTDGLF